MKRWILGLATALTVAGGLVPQLAHAGEFEGRAEMRERWDRREDRGDRREGRERFYGRRYWGRSFGERHLRRGEGWEGRGWGWDRR